MEIDTGRAHSARVYDHWLGGKNNYTVDVRAAERAAEIWPALPRVAVHNRAVMQRMTRYLVAECGVRQFLDLGSGIPTEPNLHQVAQVADPSARVVYVDNDPIVLQYAQALLRSTPEGRTAYLHAEAADVDRILESPAVRDTLDLAEPVAVSAFALLHFLTDEQGARSVVRRLLEPLAPGSHLMLTHVSPDFDPELVERAALFYHSAVTRGQARTKEEIAGFFAGLEPVEPGLVPAHRWRPDPAQRLPEISEAELGVYAGMARKS